MGRFLAGGVLTKINIWKDKDEFYRCDDLLKIKDEILSSLSEMLDLEMYDIEFSSTYICLNLKKEIFKENIHDLAKQLDKTIGCTCLHYMLYGDVLEGNLNNEDFTKEKTILELRENKKDGEVYFYCNGEEKKVDYPFGRYYQWSLSRDADVNDYIKMTPEFVPLYEDYFQFDCENDNTIPYLLNHFSREYIKDNPLFKSFFFYISG